MKKRKIAVFYDTLMSFGDKFYDKITAEPKFEPEHETKSETTKFEYIIFICFAAFVIYLNIENIEQFIIKMLTIKTYVEIFSEPIFAIFALVLFVAFVFAIAALSFYKNQDETGFKFIKSVIIVTFLAIFYLGIFAILYFAFDNKIVVISLFIAFLVGLFLIVFLLNLKNMQNFSDENDFLISYLSDQNLKPKSYFGVVKEFLLVFLAIILFMIFKKCSSFGGKGGDFGGGGASGKLK